jgi:tRNA modification GTPase
VGVATGTPDGGVAVVRLSGSRAREIAERLAGEVGEPRRLVRRRLRMDGLEDALVVWMPGPASFTGEDVVELHVHAGARNVRAVVEMLLAGGAIAAEAGEFTRRAFEHGRLGLDQAEGIAALIAAQTDAGLEQARRLVAGELGRQVAEIAAAVHALRCEVEANLDFPEDVAAGDLRRWRDEVGQWVTLMERWTRTFEAGRRSRERARIVLAGPPNAGKSSLFNILVGRERAIVSPVPGTTRDYVEAEVSLAGVEATLVDTAGMHATEDVVEAEGVRRSRTQVEGADLVLWIEAADQEIGAPPAGEVLRVESKRDLGCVRPDWIRATNTDVDAVVAAIGRWHDLKIGKVEPWIGLARHKDRVVECCEALRGADALIVDEQPLELVAFELGVAERRLAEISGRGGLGPVGEEVLHSIFSRFCIGK